MTVANPTEAPKGWNWGAFWLNWVWGLAHNTPIALLMFVPVVNLVMPFVLGWKGNAWAWQKNTWRDEDHFRRVQRIWARVGWGMAVGLPLLFGLLLCLGLGMLKSSEPYQTSLAIIRDHPKLERSLGTPVVPTGWMVSGNVSLQNDDGSAALNYEVAGPKSAGTVYLEATRQRGVWAFRSLSVVIADGTEIPLIGKGMDVGKVGGESL